MMNNRDFIAKRAAAYFKPGDVVNLGIGIPSLCGSYAVSGVLFQSENGFIGIGPKAEGLMVNERYANAGGVNFVPVPGSIASLRDTARVRLDSLLLHAEVVCEEYGQQVIEPWGYEQHWCEIVVQRPREAYQRMPGYDSLVAVTRAREFQRAVEALLHKLKEGLQEPAQGKAD